MPEKRSEGRDNVNDIYDDGEELIEYTYDNLKEEKPTSLTHAVCSNLIKPHSNYLNDVLRNISQSFIKKSHNTLLQDNFFPLLDIDKLLDLHESLSKEFEVLEHNFILIGDIFERYENKFLIYCQILAKNKELLDFLCDKISFNPDIKEETDNLVAISRKTPLNKSGYYLEELLQMIPQHIMRYATVMLAEVKKQAQKEGSKKVEKESEKAFHIMDKLLKHMDAYAKDYENILTMEQLKDILRVDMRDKGRLLFEVKDIDLWIKSDEQTYQKYHLYIFEEVIVAYQIEIREEAVKDEKGDVMTSGLFGLGNIQKQQISKESI